MEMMVMFAWTAWLLVLFTATSPAVKSKYYSETQTVDAPATLKKTHLHFFFHDTISGKNPSAILVAKPEKVVVQEGNIGPFGAVYVFDDPLTVGADPNSEVIGNGRGLYASVSRELSDWTLLFNGDLEFTRGEFNGSSISLFSRDPIFGVKEVAVVGGRGKFRMAQGFALIDAVSANATTGDAILEFHVTIFHQYMYN